MAQVLQEKMVSEGIPPPLYTHGGTIMMKSTARITFLLLILSGVIPVVGISAESLDSPPIVQCTGTCNDGTPFECTGSGATCTDGKGCTVKSGSTTITVSCDAQT